MDLVAAIGAFGGLGVGAGALVKPVETCVCVYTLGSFLSFFFCAITMDGQPLPPPQPLARNT